MIYSKLVKEHDLEFAVLHTDITADEDMTAKYIEEKIQAEVEKYLVKNPFIQWGDILNLEHVLHNIPQDLTDEEKEDLAFEI